jgi:hypothetical protein
MFLALAITVVMLAHALHDKDQGNDIVVNIGQANGGNELSSSSSKPKDLGGKKLVSSESKKSQPMCSSTGVTIFAQPAEVKALLEVGSTMGPCPSKIAPELTKHAITNRTEIAPVANTTQVEPTAPVANTTEVEPTELGTAKEPEAKKGLPKKKARVIVCIPALMKAISIPTKSLSTFIAKGAVMGLCEGVTQPTTAPAQPTTAPVTAKATAPPTAPPTLFPVIPPTLQPKVEVARAGSLEDCVDPVPPPYGRNSASETGPHIVQRQPRPFHEVQSPSFPTVNGKDAIPPLGRPAVLRIPIP